MKEDLLKDVLFYGLSIGIGFPIFIVYYRKKKWFNDKFVFGLTFSIALFGWFITLINSAAEYLLFACLISNPLLSFCLIIFFKKISEKIQGRDFILYMRGSDELVDSSIFGENPHVTFLDILFSVLSLVFIVGYLTSIILLLSK